MPELETADSAGHDPGAAGDGFQELDAVAGAGLAEALREADPPRAFDGANSKPLAIRNDFNERVSDLAPEIGATQVRKFEL